MAPHTAVYNVPIAYELNGDLNLQVLENSLNEIVARHEVLRTTFDISTECCKQTVSPDARLTLRIVNMRDQGPPSAARIQQAVDREAQQPFVLSRDLMLRACVVQCAAFRHVLVLTMHHISSDGWSLGLLVKELLEGYSSFCRGSRPRLRALPLQYRDYAAASRERLGDGELARLFSFWRAELAGAEWKGLLPCDEPRKPGGYHGHTIRDEIPAELAQRLAEAGQEHNGTTFMFMLSALQVFLHGISGSADFAIGIASANRTRLELADLIGCFVNTIPVRCHISPEIHFATLLRETREALFRVLAHQELPFSELVRGLQPRRQPGQSPFFQVQFLYQSYALPTFRGPELTGTRWDVDTATAKFDLTVIVEKRDSLRIAFEYNRSFWNSSEMRQWMNSYLAILSEAARQPERRISQLLASSQHSPDSR